MTYNLKYYTIRYYTTCIFIFFLFNKKKPIRLVVKSGFIEILKLQKLLIMGTGGLEVTLIGSSPVGSLMTLFRP